MKIHRPSQAVLSHVCILAAMLALVAFGATFGLRWALVAVVPCLVILGVAVGN